MQLFKYTCFKNWLYMYMCNLVLKFRKMVDISDIVDKNSPSNTSCIYLLQFNGSLQNSKTHLTLFPIARFLYTLLPSPRDTLELLGQMLIKWNIRYWLGCSRKNPHPHDWWDSGNSYRKRGQRLWKSRQEGGLDMKESSTVIISTDSSCDSNV